MGQGENPGAQQGGGQDQTKAPLNGQEQQNRPIKQPPQGGQVGKQEQGRGPKHEKK